MPSSQLAIFYDGGCRVCSWEVEKYLASDRRGVLRAIDILDPSFAAESYGLDPAKVRRYFHVRTPEGQVISGVDAFIEIWKALDTPMAGFASRWARLAPIHGLLRMGYWGFVRVRPYLPRKPGAPPCSDDGSCDLR